MDCTLGANTIYGFILHEYTPRQFPEGWTTTLTNKKDATALINICSIHTEPNVTVDIERCTSYALGRTVKQQKMAMYEASLRVSD